MGDDVQHLLGSVPRVPCWRLSSLPEVLSDAQIEILLASFDKDLRRAGGLTPWSGALPIWGSDPVRWRNCSLATSIGGRVRSGFCGQKGWRFDVLSQPPEMGDAIAAYRRHERPPSTNRFAAYKRCGWSQSRVHITGHSVASQMLVCP